jgi:hypothetical protein
MYDNNNVGSTQTGKPLFAPVDPESGHQTSGKIHTDDKGNVYSATLNLADVKYGMQ